MIKRSKMFWVVVIAGAIPLFIVSAYFFFTGSYFICGFILPEVGKATGFPIKADRVNLSFLKNSIYAENIVLGPPEKPFVKVEELSAVCLFREIFRGNIYVNSLKLNNAEIRLKQNLEGGWNFETPKQGADSSAGKKSPEKKKKAPSPFRLNLNVKNVAFNNINLFLEMPSAPDIKNRLEIRNLNLKIPELVTSRESRMDITGLFSLTSPYASADTTGKITLNSNFIINEKGLPEKIESVLRLSDLKGTIGDATLGNRDIVLSLKGKIPGDSLILDTFSLRELKGKSVLTEISADGKMKMPVTDFDFRVNLDRISPELITALEAMTGGYGFGKPSASMRTDISFHRGIFKSRGVLNVKKLVLTNNSALLKKLPDADIELEHDVSLDTTEKLLGINVFKFRINLAGKDILSAETVSETKVKLNSEGISFIGEKPQLYLKLNGIKLENTEFFVPEKSPVRVKKGLLSGIIYVQGEKAGKKLSVRGKFDLDGLSLSGGGNIFNGISLRNILNLSIIPPNRINVNSFRMLLKKDEKTALDTTLKGSFDIGKKIFSSTLSVACDENLPLLLPDGKPARALTGAFTGRTVNLKAKTEINPSARILNLKNFTLVVNKGSRRELSARNLEPAVISWKKEKEIRKTPFAALLEIDSLPLDIVNNFLDKKDGLKILGGTLGGEMKIVNRPTGLSVNSVLFEKGLRVRLKEKDYRPFSLKSESIVNFPPDMRGFALEKGNLKMYAADKKAAELDISGNIGLKPGKGSFDAKIKKLDHTVLNILPPEEVADIKLKNFDVSGNISASFDRENEKFTVDGKLYSMDTATSASIKNNIPPLYASLDCGIAGKSGDLKIDNVFINIKNGRKRHLADLRMKGNLFLKDAERQSKLFLDSKLINLKLLEGYFIEDRPSTQKEPGTQRLVKTGKNKWSGAESFVDSLLKKTGKTLKTVISGTEFNLTDNTDKLSTDESPPLKLDWLNLRLKMDFKKLLYGNEIKASSHSVITAVNNVFTANPFKLQINKTVIPCYAEINTGLPAGYKYVLRSSFDNLNLTPLLNAAFGEKYCKSSGMLNNFSLNLKGHGFSPGNLHKHLKGILNMNFSDIAVSHNLKEIYVLNLIFLPLNIVSELGKIIPNLSLSEDILKSIKFSKEFINNSRDIVFRKAVFKAKAENGINIEKCELKGDFIRGLSVDGYIGFDKNIRIKSNLNINKIIVPVDIYGTIDNPIPDLKSFVLLFMKENTLNALNPENIKDIIDVLDRGGKDAPDKKRKKFFDLLKIKN